MPANNHDLHSSAPDKPFFSRRGSNALLRYVGARRLIRTGIAGNFCVLFTANDAYMRDYDLVIPEDCCVSNTPRENAEALALIAEVFESGYAAFPRNQAAIDFEKTPHPQSLGFLTATGFFLKLVDFFGRLRFGQIFIKLLTGFAAERLEIGALRAGHRLAAGGPVVRILLWILHCGLFVLVCHT